MRITLPFCRKLVKTKKKQNTSGVIKMGKPVNKTKVYYNLAGGSFVGPFAIRLRGDNNERL